MLEVRKAFRKGGVMRFFRATNTWGLGATFYRALNNVYITIYIGPWALEIIR